MADRSPEEFVRAAEIRLALAAGTYKRTSGLLFSDRFIEMANVSMFVWSAGIDFISVHMLLDGEEGLGTSVSRRRYLSSRILSGNWPRRMRAGWSVLARLHSFQHNLDLRSAEFVANCRDSELFFEDLNGMLPASVRLEPTAYAWLAEVS